MACSSFIYTCPNSPFIKWILLFRVQMVSARVSPNSQEGILLFTWSTQHPLNRPAKVFLVDLGQSCASSQLVLLSPAVPFPEHIFFLSSPPPFTASPPSWACSPSPQDTTAASSPHTCPLQRCLPPSVPFLCRRMTKHLLCSIIRTAGYGRSCFLQLDVVSL